MEQQTKIPFDEQIEKAVLGAIMQNNEVLLNLTSSLKSNSFYLKKHRDIYQVMLDLFEESSPIDEIILGEKLNQKGILEDCGSYLYLIELLDSAPASENIEHYSKILREHFITREIIRISTEITEKTRTPNKNVPELLEGAQSQIEKIAQEQTEKPYQEFETNLDKTVQKIKALSENKKAYTGVQTGFSTLDKATSGLQKSDLIVVAARPGMGKTALSLNISQFIALKSNQAVAFFSLEMSAEQICTRILSSELEISSDKLRNGKLDETDWIKLNEKTEAIKEAPFYICDKGALSTFEFKTLSKQIYRKLDGNLSLIVVDYLQLMHSTNKFQNRQEEIADIARCLKSVAKELNIPIIANAQLNRDVEKRGDKRPILSDLRESGSIEQDADIILFIYREGVYDKNTQNPDVSEILVRKFRNGETGDHWLIFKGEHTKFVSVDPEYETILRNQGKEEFSSDIY